MTKNENGGSPDAEASALRGPGRPRVLDDARILGVTLDLLAEVGYQGMSLADVADRSGVSKPSLYRRWQNKAELVAAAIEHSHRARLEPCGDPRRDLVAQLRDVRTTYAATVDMGMVGALLSEERRHPEFINAWRERIVAPRRAAIQTIIRAAQEQGLIADDRPPVIIGQLLLGAFYAAYLAGDEMSEEWDEAVIDAVLAGAMPR